MNRVPWWSRILLALQLMLAVLFAMFTWLLATSIGQGRQPPVGDAAVLTVPVVLVLVFGALAIRSWRRGKRTAGGVLTVVPFLTTLPLLAMMMV